MQKHSLSPLSLSLSLLESGIELPFHCLLKSPGGTGRHRSPCLRCVTWRESMWAGSSELLTSYTWYLHWIAILELLGALFSCLGCWCKCVRVNLYASCGNLRYLNWKWRMHCFWGMYARILCHLGCLWVLVHEQVALLLVCDVCVIERKCWSCYYVSSNL